MIDGTSILIADDSVFAREVLKDILSRNGYKNIAEASDGLEVVEMYEKERPDLVLLDLIMGKMDGICALEKIMEKDRSARVIVVSATGQEDIVSQCMKLGSAGFVVKPVDEIKLMSEIKKAIEIA